MRISDWSSDVCSSDLLRHPALEPGLAADQGRLRKAILQVAHEGIRIVAEQDRTDSLLARGHQDGAERAFAHGEADGRTRSEGRRVGKESVSTGRFWWEPHT